MHARMDAYVSICIHTYMQSLVSILVLYRRLCWILLVQYFTLIFIFGDKYLLLIPLSARICPNWTSAFEAYLGGSRDKYGRIWWADGNNTNLASTYIIDIIENMLFYSVC